MLLETEDEMRSSAERYISQRVESRRNELQRRRKEETQQELDDLEAYAEAERERIETFITEYERKAEAGTDMDIAIRKQRNRLSKLEERIEKRRSELQRKAQIISVAPEVENLCLTLPIN
jgi:DNA-binding transcriptional regulator YbjK